KPAFDRYGDFWTTGLGAASADGSGLADYSNRGFFTPDNNLGDSRYSSPPSDRSAYVENPVTRNGRIDLYLDGTVHDSLLNTDSRRIHRTRSSLLDQSLIQVASEFTPPLSNPEIFSIDRDVFD